MAWLYVPGLAASSLDCDAPSQDLKLYVLSNGKPTPQPYSWRGWKNKPWSQPLFGTISQPSTAKRGVAKWISSQQASPVSRLASPASKKARTTSGGSGTTLGESFAKYDRASCAWKTYPALFAEVFPTSSQTWPSSGGMQNGVCSQRPAAERRISDAGSSCSLPTPSACSYGAQKSPSKGAAVRPSLETMARNALWPNNQFDPGPLNPAWVEWLMGFPTGWTDCTPLGTESFREWQREHSELCMGGSPNE